MLVKQAIDVSFAQGLDTKTDPKRVAVGKFVQLENTVFTKGGLLQKRNGFGSLPSLADSSFSYVTTFNGNLAALAGTNNADLEGQRMEVLSESVNSWVEKSAPTPLSLATLPLVRNNYNQTLGDVAVAPNGLVCAAYSESDGNFTTPHCVISDSATGQVIAVNSLPLIGSAVLGMRVFVLADYFIVVYTDNVSGTNHLKRFAIPLATQTPPGGSADILASYTPATGLSWDGVVSNGVLVVAAYAGSGISVVTLTNSLVATVVATLSTGTITLLTVCLDASTGDFIIVWYDSTATATKFAVLSPTFTTVRAATTAMTTFVPLNITAVATSGNVQILYEAPNNYPDWSTTNIPSHYISSHTFAYVAGTPGALSVTIRSVGLASKAFLIDGQTYFLAAFQSSYQPTYFLICAELRASYGIVYSSSICAKLAYQNGGGYVTHGLPGVSVTGSTAQVGYLYKDLIAAVNKDTNVSAGTQVNGIYSQTGVNLAAFTLSAVGLDTAEIASNLHIAGGFLWSYDGSNTVEHNFFLYPDVDAGATTDVAAWSTTSGSMHAQPDGSTNTNAYFYQFTYEWTDNQGNAFRSAPSVPVPVTTTGSGTTGSVLLHIPTLRLTYKTQTPVKIVIYRWSVGQQIYYQTTSITQPFQNETDIDMLTYQDKNADATILGNNILYTNGGVVEDVNAPASNVLTLFDTRLWLVDAEDQNLLWYSKQVIEATPVEMSDLFTLYVPPTTSTQGPTGPMLTLAPMDDKLIIGKENAFLYINGTGPDNTGVSNNYSPATFITSTVGCANQKSIVLMPEGLMFEAGSNKGIWLLDRDLGTSYIGAPVEDFTTGATVTSAVNVPGTNQVRFTLSTGVTLMYDYYYEQWGSFVGIAAVSSCIYNGLHTIIDAAGDVFQETPDEYLDGTNPVLMMFQTGPLRLGDLQNYQRAYFFYILGEYLSPHQLVVSLAYDYSSTASQQITFTPVNSSYGGAGTPEDERFFLERQRCQAFSIQIQEVFDASVGLPAGAGLTLSGLNIVMAFKRGFRPQSSATSVG